MSKGRILITGGRGMLASDFARVSAEKGFDVFSLGHEQLDVTQHDQVKSALQNIKPQYVMHTVGLLVDYCQENPGEALRTHVWGTSCIARECHRVQATLINISTCGLFRDERQFYSEYDQVRLKTRYAESKYEAEKAASQFCERVYNVRPGWLFGGAIEHKKNFVYQRYLESQRVPMMKSVGDKFGCPTYTQDLSEKLLELLKTEAYGLYHMTSQGEASRYDYVKAILKAFGASTPMQMVDSTAFIRSSPVPDCEVLDNCNLQFLNLSLLPHWEESIERYVKTIKSS